METAGTMKPRCVHGSCVCHTHVQTGRYEPIDTSRSRRRRLHSCAAIGDGDISDARMRRPLPRFSRSSTFVGKAHPAATLSIKSRQVLPRQASLSHVAAIPRRHLHRTFPSPPPCALRLPHPVRTPFAPPSVPLHASLTVFPVFPVLPFFHGRSSRAKIGRWSAIGLNIIGRRSRPR